MSNEEMVTSNKKKLMSNEQNLTSNKWKVTSKNATRNKQKLMTNKQWEKGVTSIFFNRSINKFENVFTISTWKG